MARSVLFCEHRDLSCCARPGDLCSGASPGMPGWYFGQNQEPLISYFRELTANPWEHVFFKYMFQTYKGPIRIDASSKVIAMLQSMSSNGYQKRIIMTKNVFSPVDWPKLVRRFFRFLFSRELGTPTFFFGPVSAALGIGPRPSVSALGPRPPAEKQTL